MSLDYIARALDDLAPGWVEPRAVAMQAVGYNAVFLHAVELAEADGLRGVAFDGGNETIVWGEQPRAEIPEADPRQIALDRLSAATSAAIWQHWPAYAQANALTELSVLADIRRIRPLTVEELTVMSRTEKMRVWIEACRAEHARRAEWVAAASLAEIASCDFQGGYPAWTEPLEAVPLTVQALGQTLHATPETRQALVSAYMIADILGAPIEPGYGITGAWASSALREALALVQLRLGAES